MGYHYSGYKQPPCPEVRMALDSSWWPGLQKHYELSDAERAERRNARVKKWRDRGRRRRLLMEEGIGAP